MKRYFFRRFLVEFIKISEKNQRNLRERVFSDYKKDFSFTLSFIIYHSSLIDIMSLKKIAVDEVPRAYLIGMLLLACGSILFSGKAIFVKIAYRYDTDASTLLALRMLFSMPIYALIAYSVQKKAETKVILTQKQWIFTILAGFSGYYVGSLTDFMGLKYISAGMERLILFTFPTMVLILNALFFKIKVTKHQYIAIFLTYLGIFIAFQADLTAGTQINIPLGSLLVFGSAFTYSIYYVLAGQMIPIVGSVLFSCYTMLAAGVFVLLHNFWVNGWLFLHQNPIIYLIGAAIAIFATVIPTTLIAEGIKRVGSSNGAIVGFIGPVSMIFMANIFLGEKITFLQLLGTAVVLIGVLRVAKK
jgi:drug/metabolite transporter (DMT)-like permease